MPRHRGEGKKTLIPGAGANQGREGGWLGQAVGRSRRDAVATAWGTRAGIGSLPEDLGPGGPGTQAGGGRLA